MLMIQMNDGGKCNLRLYKAAYYKRSNGIFFNDEKHRRSSGNDKSYQVFGK